MSMGMGGYGLALQALGIASSAYGEHQGAVGLERAKEGEIRDQMAFDAQRQGTIGRYVDTLGPMMRTDDAAATQQAHLAGGATAGAGAGAAALGVRGVSPITAASRAGTRAGGMQQRLMGNEINQMRSDSALGEIERNRGNTALLYPELERQGALRGQGFRQMGTYLGAGGQAVSAYGMMSNGGSGNAAGQEGVDPNGYNNNPSQTDRLQGPSAYRGY